MCISLSRPRITVIFSILILIVLAVLMRWHYITEAPLHIDEIYSFTAIESIVNTGLPTLPSGALYPRSPLHLYLSAASLHLFGHNLVSARLVSLFFFFASISRRLASRMLAIRCFVLWSKTAVAPAPSGSQTKTVPSTALSRCRKLPTLMFGMPSEVPCGSNLGTRLKS